MSVGCEEYVDPPDAVNLHRLCWEPDDFDNGLPTTSVFPRDDLTDRYLSVHRMDRLDPSAVLRIADQQRQKAHADSNDLVREDAMSVILSCSEVRTATDSEGVRPFIVSPEREQDDRAHCGIRNVTGKRGRGYVNQLRSLLLERIVETSRLTDTLVRYQ